MRELLDVWLCVGLELGHELAGAQTDADIDAPIRTGARTSTPTPSGGIGTRASFGANAANVDGGDVETPSGSLPGMERQGAPSSFPPATTVVLGGAYKADADVEGAARCARLPTFPLCPLGGLAQRPFKALAL